MKQLLTRPKDITLTLPDGSELEGTRISFKGRVEASTIQAFQAAIEEQINRGRNHLFIDLAGVEYITSTGMGGLVKYYNLVTEKRGTLSLLKPPESVLNVVQLLGLADILPIYDSLEDLQQNFLKKRGQRPASDDDLTAQQRLSMLRAEASAGKVQASKAQKVEIPVVLAVPEVDLFAMLTADLLQNEGVKVTLATTAEEAFKVIERDHAAAIIVDFLLPKYQALCRKIKLTPQTSTCSIILIYEEGNSPEMVKELAFLPNEHVVEPFPLQKLASLAKSEIERKRSETTFINHEMHFRFPSSLEWIDKANKILEQVLQKPYGHHKTAYLAVKSSVREAIDNANRHGNKEDGSKSIDVIYLLDKEKTTISVKDCGEGFDYQKYLDSIQGKQAIELAERRDFNSLGGLGIALMMKCTDQLSYNKKGNMVTQVKHLPTHAQAAAAGAAAG